MARRFSIDATTGDLISQLETELDSLEAATEMATITQYRPADETKSYLFIDKGVLKVFNAITGEEKEITIS